MVLEQLVFSCFDWLSYVSQDTGFTALSSSKQTVDERWMGQHTTTSPADLQQRFTNISQLRGEELEVQKIQCPICLRAVPPTADAFLEPCFHAFCREVGSNLVHY